MIAMNRLCTLLKKRTPLGNRLILLVLITVITACSPVKTTISNQYLLSTFSAIPSPTASHKTIFVTPPEAMSGYQSEQMMYINKPFELSTFAHNAWVSPPAEMLLPLLVQSLQASRYFFAVASGVNANDTDFRLDTQLIALHQSFLTQPSTLFFTAKVIMTRVSDTHVLASQVVHLQIPCPSDTPYGGVQAANKAMILFTKDATSFAIKASNK